MVCIWPERNLEEAPEDFVGRGVLIVVASRLGKGRSRSRSRARGDWRLAAAGFLPPSPTYIFLLFFVGCQQRAKMQRKLASGASHGPFFTKNRRRIRRKKAAAGRKGRRKDKAVKLGQQLWGAFSFCSAGDMAICACTQKLCQRRRTPWRAACAP